MNNKSSLLAALAIATLATGCKQSNPADENPATKDTNSLSVTQQLQNAKETATNAWSNMKEGTSNVWANTKQATSNAWIEVRDSLQTTKDYTYDKKDAFVAGASADLDALDQKIKALSDKAATASDSVRTDAQTQIEALHDKRVELGKKLDNVKNSAAANWNDVKTGFQNSYDDVKTSLKQAWQWLTDKLSS